MTVEQLWHHAALDSLTDNFEIIAAEDLADLTVALKGKEKAIKWTLDVTVAFLDSCYSDGIEKTNVALVLQAIIAASSPSLVRAEANLVLASLNKSQNRPALQPRAALLQAVS